MFTEQEFEIYAQRIVDLYEPINRHYLELMAQHIKDIGKLTPTDVHRLTQIQRMNKNAKEIASELAIATQKAEVEIEAMFDEMAQDYYDFSEQYYDAQGLVQVPWSENKAMQQIVAAQVKTTQGALLNLASTTASQLKNNPSDYRQLLDCAIRQSSLGVTDYTTAIRSTVRTVAKRGIRCIDFDSGYKRRIDSQIRMNILDGARTQAINVAEQAGKEYGADGVEISAHGLCAVDHLFIQGKQYAKKAWEKINAGLERAIGTLNCKHFAFPILLGISEPAHTQAELDAINKTSTATTTIDGKTKSGYEWTQEQRKLETKIREQKDIAVAAAAEGDMTLRREAQAKMNAYRAEYDDISEKANLIQKPERMTVSGFHRVKALPKQTAGGKINKNGYLFVSPQITDHQYQQILEGRFNNGTSIAQKIYLKYIPNGGGVANNAYMGTPHYSPSKNVINMNLQRDGANLRGVGTTWYHEHGHYVDGNSGMPSLTPSYRSALLQDVANHEKTVKKANGLKTITDARNLIADDFVKNGVHKTHSIQDIYGGAIKRRYRNDLYGHPAKYWKAHGANGVSLEAFAHMFEASFSSEKTNMMKQYFPSAWAEFEKILKGL